MNSIGSCVETHCSWIMPEFLADFDAWRSRSYIKLCKMIARKFVPFGSLWSSKTSKPNFPDDPKKARKLIAFFRSFISWKFRKFWDQNMLYKTKSCNMKGKRKDRRKSNWIGLIYRWPTYLSGSTSTESYTICQAN